MVWELFWKTDKLEYHIEEILMKPAWQTWIYQHRKRTKHTQKNMPHTKT